MLILSADLGYRLLSEMQAVVCLNLGPVFVLRFRPRFPQGAADHPGSAGSSVPACGVVTSTTLEGGESPEAFHA
jgi:hypothetical protein